MSWTRGCRSMLVGFVLAVRREACSVDVKCNRCQVIFIRTAVKGICGKERYIMLFIAQGVA